MTDDERRTIDVFKVGVSLIRTGLDGFPPPEQGLELEIVAGSALKVRVVLARYGDDLDAERRSVLNLADATSRLIAATASGERDPEIAEAWFKARAELIEPDD
jgi:hypothetical protein